MAESRSWKDAGSVGEVKRLTNLPEEGSPEAIAVSKGAQDITFKPYAPTTIQQQQKPPGGSTIAPEPPAQEQDPDALVKGGNVKQADEEEKKTAFQKAAAAIGAIGERESPDPGGVAAPAAGGPALPPDPFAASPAARIHAAQKKQAAADLKEKTRVFRASPGNQIAIREGMATYKSR
jgi:hypothetical protein